MYVKVKSCFKLQLVLVTQTTKTVILSLPNTDINKPGKLQNDTYMYVTDSRWRWRQVPATFSSACQRRYTAIILLNKHLL